MNNHNITAGTPRGFNLSNMPMGMSSFPPNFTPGGSFAPFPQFGNHTVQAPGGWPMNSGVAANGDESHRGGPMRRGGGGRFNTRPGPYDRNQRFNNDGRLTPMGNGNLMNRRGGFGSGGKWGDGGAQTVGPREAVQGRTIKKYDDLDAVEGGAAGELNY